jgi:hypothetical protein
LRLQWLVGDGVDAHPEELLPDARAPVVLDLVVRPPGEPRRDLGPPARGGRGGARKQSTMSERVGNKAPPAQANEAEKT